MADKQPGIVKKMTFGDEEFDVPFAKGNPGKTREELDEIKRRMREDPEAAGDGEMVATMGFCAKYDPHTYMTDIPGVMCERDVACVLRDGTTIYADIYRPANTTRRFLSSACSHPSARTPPRAWTPGSSWAFRPRRSPRTPSSRRPTPGTGAITATPWPTSTRAAWAIPRATSTGGSQDAQDGYDFIEWVTAQEWCNGRATMIGNSGVCMAHWRIAATRPPHLACLAAWEGQGDLYRESYFCGGIPDPDYETHIIQALAVNNYIEDTPAMVAEYPLMNAYYKDKIVDWNKIRIPTYVTAGWVHHHLRGAFKGFRRIRTPKKWMRAHRDFEWPDTYTPENMEDLRKFFDRYCKEIHNGWEMSTARAPRRHGRLRLRLRQPPRRGHLPAQAHRVQEALLERRGRLRELREPRR